MAAYGNYALRLPASLMEDVRRAAESDGVSMNGFIVQAVAEKVAALRARGLLRNLTPDEQLTHLGARSARARPSDLQDTLAKAGTTTDVLPGDEVPDGWQTGRPAAR